MRAVSFSCWIIARACDYACIHLNSQRRRIRHWGRIAKPSLTAAPPSSQLLSVWMCVYVCVCFADSYPHRLNPVMPEALWRLSSSLETTGQFAEAVEVRVRVCC